MSVSRRHRPVIAAFIAAFIGAVPAKALTEEAVKDAQALLDQARNAVALGQASKLDVLMANAFLLEMKFRSKQISRKAYCKEALPKLREIATMSGNPLRRESIKDLISFERQLYELTVLCRG